MYIGTKIVHAVSMTRADYNTYRGWTLPADDKVVPWLANQTDVTAEDWNIV